GANYLKEKFPAAKTIIGSRVVEVQKLFKGVFNIGDEDLKADGSAFDMLLEDEQVLPLGSINVRVMHTPGHTPACVSYVVGDALFCGDTVFLPDFGSARCDFPSGDAKALYTSVTTKLFSLPDETRVFVGHDYAPGGRPIAWESTIGDEKAKNKHLHTGVTEAEFVDMRTTRDSTLAAPKLILPSLQVNLRNGKLPTPESNGVSYLKIPLNKL
ncbi:gloB2, partial [Symbiodinium sp. KB8]